MDKQTLSRGPAGQHPTCTEVTGPGDIARGERTWICGQDCPRPAGPNPARDRRRDLYADRERRRAARALDRYLDAFNEFGTAGSTGARVAGERFVEQVGDYVLARLNASIEAELGPSAARDVADRMHDEAYGLHQKAHYDVSPKREQGFLFGSDAGPEYEHDKCIWPNSACIGHAPNTVTPDYGVPKCKIELERSGAWPVHTNPPDGACDCKSRIDCPRGGVPTDPCAGGRCSDPGAHDL